MLNSELPDAECKCEEYADEAMKLDAENPEVYSTFASVRLSQCRNDDALKYLISGKSKWYKVDQDEEIRIDPDWPLIDTRMNYAKLFMETGSFDNALQCLVTCEAEDEEDLQLWYLYGWCYYQMALQDTIAKDELIQDARESFETLLKVGND